MAFMFMSVGCILIYPLMLAIQAETFAEYTAQGLHLFMCSASPGQLFFLRKSISFVIIWLMLFLNFFSTRRVGARFQMASFIAKLLAAAVIVGRAAYLLVFEGF